MIRLRRLSTSQDAHVVAVGERGHLHHRARVVSEDAAGRSISFTPCVCGSVTGLNPLPLASSVSNARDAYAAAAGRRGAYTPSSVVCYDPRNAHEMFTSCPSFCWTSLYPIPRDSYFKVSADRAGRLYGRCWSALHQYLLPQLSSARTMGADHFIAQPVAV